jgi:hypothetical protein
MGRADLKASLEHYRVSLIILKQRFSQKVRPLTSLGWVLIHLDDRFFLTLPQRPDTEDLIRREGYHHIVP